MYIKSFDLKHNILNKETKTTDNDLDNMGTLKFYPRLNAIFIPNSSLIEYFNRELREKNGYYAKLEVQRIMMDRGLMKVNNELNENSLIIFYLLHEEGHYIHFNNNFLSSNLSIEHYLDQYEIYKKQRGGRDCLDRKQGFISGKLLLVHDHAAACFCNSVPK